MPHAVPIANPGPAAMSAASSPESKRRGSTSATEDDIIPLIIAGNPGLVLNYKQMAACSKGKYTWSSLEHKFRKWKAVAKELHADNVEGAEGGAASSTVETAKKRQAAKPLAKRPRAPKKATQDQDSEDEEEEGKKTKANKRSKVGSADAEEKPVIKEEIRKAAQKFKEASKNGGSPALELPKGQKKGTARVVKKDRLRGGGDEDEEEELEGKGKGNGKGGDMKGKAVKVEESEDDEDGGDADGVLGQMQFELENR